MKTNIKLYNYEELYTYIIGKYIKLTVVNSSVRNMTISNKKHALDMVKILNKIAIMSKNLD